MKDKTSENELEQQIRINSRANDISLINAKLSIITINLLKLSLKKLKFLNGDDPEVTKEIHEHEKEIEFIEMDYRVLELLNKRKNGN